MIRPTISEQTLEKLYSINPKQTRIESVEETLLILIQKYEKLIEVSR